MAQDNCQKIKMLKLLELLQQETDEQHPMTTLEITARLGAMGISCERRTLAKDIALLNTQGYEVMSCWVNREKGYYIEDRSFSVPEIKILIDAVQAANFITAGKTKVLIDKIADLSGSHRAEILKSNLIQFNTRKHTNENIYYNIDALETAIQERKKVLFRYFDLNIKLEKQYRRDGHRYVVEPVALVFNEDNYYLVCYSARHDDVTSYRVDRMDAVNIIDESISKRAIELRASVSEFTEESIKMFAGEREDVVLEFGSQLIGAVYDRFGENTEMLSSGVNCVATVQVRNSPTFWGWLFQFGTDIKVLSPSWVVKAYRDRLSALLEVEKNCEA